MFDSITSTVFGFGIGIIVSMFIFWIDRYIVEPREVRKEGLRGEDLET